MYLFSGNYESITKANNALVLISENAHGIIFWRENEAE